MRLLWGNLGLGFGNAGSLKFEKRAGFVKFVDVLTDDDTR